MAHSDAFSLHGDVAAVLFFIIVFMILDLISQKYNFMLVLNG